jgi:hypothetical protein
MGNLQILLAPLDWWRVRHPAVRALNLVVPGFIALIIGLVILLSPTKVNIFGEYGIVHQANGLMQILSGFYIASLAAIATFNRPGLDEIMKGDPPRFKRNGTLKEEELTRRRFLCLLFGYLSFAAIALYVLGATAMIAAPALAAGIPEGAARDALRFAFAYLFGFFSAQLLLATFLGIHYMAVRIQEPDAPAGGYSRLASPDSSREEDKAPSS